MDRLKTMDISKKLKGPASGVLGLGFYLNKYATISTSFSLWLHLHVIYFFTLDDPLFCSQKLQIRCKHNDLQYNRCPNPPTKFESQTIPLIKK